MTNPRFEEVRTEAADAITDGELRSVTPRFVGFGQRYDHLGGTTCEFSVPERVRKLDAAETGAFDPRVCRLRFDAWGPVAVHDVPVGATTLFPYRADLVAGDDAERVRDGVDALRVADRALDGSQADEGP